jgi:BolA protein
VNSNPPPADTLARMRTLLQAALQPSELQIEDDSAAHAGHAGAREGGHYRLRIRSSLFAGLAPLARHRLVYDALGPLASLGVHALSIDARLPA